MFTHSFVHLLVANKKRIKKEVIEGLRDLYGIYVKANSSLTCLVTGC